ncbi:MAG: DUF488 domain-containing protein [Patescibacteria group bacterium]
MDIILKRIYEPASRNDGFRVLVDRLWPRGIKKEEAKIDLWLKEIAPSNELRKWFGHNDDKWSEFKQKYFLELESNRGELENLKKHKNITLLFAAKDTEHNNAVAIKEYTEKKF